MAYDHYDVSTLWQINIMENDCYVKSCLGHKWYLSLAFKFRTNDIMDCEGDPVFLLLLILFTLYYFLLL